MKTLYVVTNRMNDKQIKQLEQLGYKVIIILK